VEGSEEYFDESEHVDGLAEEERSTDGEDGFGEEVDETRERGREREREGPKTRVGLPEEPQLRVVLMVRFRKSSNARRIAVMSQCVGYGVISRVRTREKDAAVRRGVALRRRRVVRKMARMQKRVTRRWRCGMRCRKPCQRWSMKSLTRLPRPIFDQGLKRRDSLRHHPKRQFGLRMCLVYLYLFISCVQLRLSSEDFQ